MSAFDASWLAQHQTKMASFRGEPIRPAPLLIEFSIPHALKLPNQTNGRFWPASHAYRKRLLPMVAEAVNPWAGHQPMERARLTFTRYSVGTPDPDAVHGCIKPLLDLLLVQSKTHPSSFGLIRDDSPDLIEYMAVGIKVAHRAEQRTSVRIERLA
jgi:hypothetical protein